MCLWRKCFSLLIKITFWKLKIGNFDWQLDGNHAFKPANKNTIIISKNRKAINVIVRDKLYPIIQKYVQLFLKTL